MEPFTIHPDTTVGPARLTIADTERALAFYVGVLGMQAEQQGATTLLSVGAGPLLILDERPDAPARPPRSTGLYHVALLMPSRRELARVLRRLAEERYPIAGASDHLVSEALYLDDPDGNGLEIYADRPRSAWPRAGDEVRMSTEPIDIDGLLAELDDTPWTGLSAGSIVGHMHLNVADLGSAQSFYCGILGFDLMQRFGSSALFLSAGGYHHHLGMNTWAGVGAPPPPADALGLRYFGVRLPDQAALAQVVDRVRAAGIELEELPDGLLVRDPSRNGVLLSTQS